MSSTYPDNREIPTKLHILVVADTIIKEIMEPFLEMNSLVRNQIDSLLADYSNFYIL